MALKDVREIFVETSGRLDLVNSDGSDNGADFYINAAQRWLDYLVEKHEDIARYFPAIESGDYFVYFENCRAIHWVGVGTTESFQWLTRKTIIDLRSLYNKPFEFIDQGTPLYFAPAYLRPANHKSSDFDGYVGYMDVIEDWHRYNGVILAPPADQTYHVEVWGKFYSNKLIDDNDESFWTENHHHVLVMAAQRALEIFYRNSQGVADWTAVIKDEIQGIGMDFVEDSYFDIDQLEG